MRFRLEAITHEEPLGFVKTLPSVSHMQVPS